MLPMAFVVTVPVRLLLGLGDWRQLLGCGLAAGISLLVSRLVWRAALASYSSASS